MTEAGEIYHDNVFDSEVTVVAVESDTVKIDDMVGGEGIRGVRRKYDWEHNVSVGRYRKVGETEVGEPDPESETEMGEKKDSIFDF